MITKKTITFTMDIEIIDELREISKDEDLKLSAIAQKLFLDWLVLRDKHDIYDKKRTR